jgi:hypothetical protein
MTAWRVDPAGLNGILTEANLAVQGINTALSGPAVPAGGVPVEGPGATLGEVELAAGYDGIVSGAFSQFMQETYNGAITRMFASYAAALEGTANAANAYLAGDEAMASSIAAGIGASDFAAASFAPPAADDDGGEG